MAGAIRSRGRIRPDVWFEALFGFVEDGSQAATMRSKMRFSAADGQLISEVNGESFGAGFFTTPSLGELRREGNELFKPADAPRLKVVHFPVKDIFALHSDPQFKRATFMAASQFNCLEFPHADVVPEAPRAIQ